MLSFFYVVVAIKMAPNCNLRFWRLPKRDDEKVMDERCDLNGCGLATSGKDGRQLVYAEKLWKRTWL